MLRDRSWTRGFRAPRGSEAGPQTAEEGVRSEDGQGMVEYGLIIALISIAAIAMLVLFRDPLQQVFSNALNYLQKYG